MTKKVLIVDDNPIDARIVKDTLEKEDIVVAIATTGKEGIEKAHSLKPDLIVLDLVLPQMSGYDICSQLKKDENALNKPIIVILSIKDNVSDITEAFNRGADDYLIKPSMPDFLAKKIKLYLGIR